MAKQGTKNPFNLVVLVAALGYFVDIYDLQLFNVVSKTSIRGIGITDPAIVDRYDYLLFLWQMTGMLVGGLLWGILGDQKGRKSVLFGSILLYSLANVANAFVVDLTQYSIIRFIAGVGLAGELGAAITLVSEIMHKEHRGYGTMLIVTMGALGAVAAALISNNPFHFFGLQPWQIAYLIGGGLGLLLLFLRVGTYESGMFDQLKENKKVKKGNFFMLFTDRKRFTKYLACILIGLPVWYCIGILIKFSEKFAGIVGVAGEVKVGFAIMYAYIGLSIGDLLSGILSQVFKSRKKIVMGYLVGTIVLCSIFLFAKGLTANAYYFMCFLLGCATGYWALFVTIASEQFGTNIRATVTTTVPNFVRGAVVPITLGFKTMELTMGSVQSAVIVGVICVGLAMIATWSIKETFSKDLDYLELS
jgi:MFS transporter, putative metabolite:H+ symporter